MVAEQLEAYPRSYHPSFSHHTTQVLGINQQSSLENE